MQLAQEASEAAGSAEANQEKYEESYAGKLQQISTNTQEIWLNILNSDTFDKILDNIVKITDGMVEFSESIGPVKTGLTGIGAILAIVFAKNIFKNLKNIGDVLVKIGTFDLKYEGLINVAKDSKFISGLSFITANIKAIGIGLAKIAIPIALLTGAGIAIYKIVSATSSLNKKIKETSDNLDKRNSELKDTVKSLEKYESIINDSNSSIDDITDARTSLYEVEQELLKTYEGQADALAIIRGYANGQTSLSDLEEGLSRENYKILKNEIDHMYDWNSEDGFLDNIGKKLSVLGLRLFDGFDPENQTISGLAIRDIEKYSTTFLNKGLSKKQSAELGNIFRKFAPYNTSTNEIGDVNMRGSAYEVEAVLKQIEAYLENTGDEYDLLSSIRSEISRVENTIENNGEIYKAYAVEKMYVGRDNGESTDYDSYMKVVDAYNSYQASINDSGVSDNEKNQAKNNFIEILDSVTSDPHVSQSVKDYIDEMYGTYKSYIQHDRFLNDFVNGDIDSVAVDNGTKSVLNTEAENELYLINRDIENKQATIDGLNDRIAIAKQNGNRELANEYYEEIDGYKKEISALEASRDEILNDPKNYHEVNDYVIYENVSDEIDSVIQKLQDEYDGRLTTEQLLNMLNDENTTFEGKDILLELKARYQIGFNDIVNVIHDNTNLIKTTQEQAISDLLGDDYLEQLSEYFGGETSEYAAAVARLKSIKLDDERERIAKELRKYQNEVYPDGTLLLAARPTVSADQMKAAGWDIEDDSYATTFTNTIASEDVGLEAGMAVNLTPILVKEDGSTVIFTEEELLNYAKEIFTGAIEDEDTISGIQIGAVYEGDHAIREAESDAEKIHLLQQRYYSEDADLMWDLVTSQQKLTKETYKYSDALKNVQDTEKAFDKLDAIYADLLDGNTKDGKNFNYEALTSDDFRELFANYESYENFLKSVTDNTREITEDSQDMFNELVTEMIYASKVFDDLDSSTEQYTKDLLKQNGIVNAEEFVEQALTSKLEYKNFVLNENLDISEDLDDATLSNIMKFYDEAEAVGVDTDAIMEYWLAKNESNLKQILTNGDVSQLEALYNATGKCIAGLNAYIKVKKAAADTEVTTGNLRNQISSNTKELMTTSSMSRRMELINANNQLNKEISEIEASQADALQAALDQAFVEISEKYMADFTKAEYGGGEASQNVKDAAKDAIETFDWVEVMIQRLEREITNLGTVANGTWRSWSERNSSLASEISKTTSELQLQADAYATYMAKANSIGLSEDYKQKVRDGRLQIEDIADEDLKELINKYKEWYEKAIACEDATLRLKDSLAALAKEGFEAVKTRADEALKPIEHFTAMVDKQIEKAELLNQIAGRSFYQANIAKDNERIAILETEKAELQNKLAEGLASGAITQDSSDYLAMMADIDAIDEERDDRELDILKQQENIADVWLKISDKIGSNTKSLLSLLTGRMDIIDAFSSLMEEAGYVVSSKVYEAQVAAQEEIYKQTIAEFDALVKTREDAIASGEVDTERIIELTNAIDDAGVASIEAKTKMVQLQNKIREIADDLYNLFQGSIDKVLSDNEFIRKVLSFDDDMANYTRAQDGTKLFNGTLNKNGYAYLGTMISDYLLNEQRIQKAQETVAKNRAEYDQDRNNDKARQRVVESEKVLQDYLDARLDTSEKIKSLFEDVYGKMLNSVKFMTDSYKESLNTQKSIYDYQKKMQELVDSRDNIQKQLVAYAGDGSEEAMATMQQLTKQLRDANSNIEESEYDQWISDTSKLLDDFNSNLETFTNQKLDDITGIVATGINGVTEALRDSGEGSIIGTINNSIPEIEYAIGEDTKAINEAVSSDLYNLGETIISGGEGSTGLAGINGQLSEYFGDGRPNNLKGVIENLYKYYTEELPQTIDQYLGKDSETNKLLSHVYSYINDSNTSYTGPNGFGTTNTLLDSINNFIKGDFKKAVDAMAVDIAELKKIESNKVTATASAPANTGNAGDVSSSGNGTGTSGDNPDKDKEQKKPTGRYVYEPIYEYCTQTSAGAELQKWTTDKSTAEKAAEKYNSSDNYNGQAYVIERDTGEKKKVWKAYFRGTHNVRDDEYAWTQEYGQEAIISPTSRAILTPLKAGDSVLTRAETENLYDIAQIPAYKLMAQLEATKAQMSSLRMGAVVQPTAGYSGNVNNNINMNVSLPNVSNYNDFINQIQTDKRFERIVQSMTLGVAMGKNSYSKNRY